MKANVNGYAIPNHVSLKLGIQNLRSYLKLICENELHILSNHKVSATKDHGENYMKSDHPLSAIFCVIVYIATPSGSMDSKSLIG